MLRAAHARISKPESKSYAIEAYWTLDPRELKRCLGSGTEGLTAAQAAQRLRMVGRNVLDGHVSASRLRVLWMQLRSPLLLLLVFAAAASAFEGQWLDALIVLLIVLLTIGIGYRRECGAQRAMKALRARIRTTSQVVRDGKVQNISLEEVVPGDMVFLSAGSLVPADAVVIEAAACYVSQAVLTGESFPVLKQPGLSARDASLAERTNCVYLGTNVRSGTAICIAIETGRRTQFGRIAQRLTLRPPETEFDRGIRHFGYLLTSAMLIMVLAVFAVHVFRGRAPVETLLFSIALAVGLSPELLPAILSVNLARAAEAMAQRGVLVRRLSAIENLGSMDVLCTDKTGTLTEGVVRLQGALDAQGVPSELVLRLGALNATLESGLNSPLDEAIVKGHEPDLSHVEKLAEVPFDFVRKRVSVVLRDGNVVRLIAKGAVQQVLSACTCSASGLPLVAEERTRIEAQVRALEESGVRALAVATRELGEQPAYGRSDEQELCFQGLLTFSDRPKAGVADAIRDLSKRGVAIKLITGDTRHVAQHVARLVGLDAEQVLTGKDLDELNDEALWGAAERTVLFVEADPNQKERIILSLKKMGHVVGFLGDGVNDAPAMHAADTSISVDSAADVAREAADFVLLERDLSVIGSGIDQGRKTFANTLKYVLTTMSANLGNMVSMAAVSLFVPFLPMLASQILLNNFLSDLPAVGIAEDRVDPELVTRPNRWDMRFIGQFMIEFGALSSLFDLLTFAVLLGYFHASTEEFRSGWFVESLLTELAIALVVRTRRPFFRSRPGRVLRDTTLALVVLTLAIPYLPGVSLLGLVPLPLPLMLTLVAITLSYVLAAELTKHWFYRRRPDLRAMLSFPS